MHALSKGGVNCIPLAIAYILAQAFERFRTRSSMKECSGQFLLNVVTFNLMRSLLFVKRGNLPMNYLNWFIMMQGVVVYNLSSLPLCLMDFLLFF